MTENISQSTPLTVCKKLGIPKTIKRSRGGRSVVKSISLISTVGFCLGIILQIIAYQNIEAPLIGIFFLLLGSFIFQRRSVLGGRCEIKAFLLFFSVCYLWAGIAGIYSAYLSDFSQNEDALWFFELATRTASGLTLNEIRELTEGAGAIYIWRAIYDLFSSIGFQKGTYIAVIFNTFLVSISGVVAIKSVRLIFNHDQYKLERFMLLFAVCGFFLLFAATMLRDSFILILNTLLIYVIVLYLMRPKLATALLLVGFSVISTEIFLILRTEFFFVPMAMLVAALGAIFVTGFFSRLSGILSIFLIIGVLGLFLFILPSSMMDITEILVSGNEQYGVSAKNLNINGSSLGAAYVVNQPILVRLVVGSFYLQVFPIPFWHGLYTESIYHLLKSLNAIFMWFVIPLAILGVRRSLQVKKEQKKVALLFLIIIYAGFTIAIAGTSLETRHLGVFLVPLLIVATVPDLTLRSDAQIYLKLLGTWLGLIIFIHITWAILKVV